MEKAKKPALKLKLNRATLRVLTLQQLRSVQGASIEACSNNGECYPIGGGGDGGGSDAVCRTSWLA